LDFIDVGLNLLSFGKGVLDRVFNNLELFGNFFKAADRLVTFGSAIEFLNFFILLTKLIINLSNIVSDQIKFVLILLNVVLFTPVISSLI